MNHSAAMMATLDALGPLLVPGAVIVLDDFGQVPYVDQNLAGVAWFKQRRAPIPGAPDRPGDRDLMKSGTPRE
jgi:hypothetical protein